MDKNGWSVIIIHNIIFHIYTYTCIEIFNILNLEIDHQRTIYGNVNTSLAWVNTAEDSGCDISRVSLHHECELESFDEMVTREMEVIIPSENLWMTDVNISSSISSSEETMR